MDAATERNVLYALCLLVVVLALVALNQGFKELNYRVIGVALGLIGVVIVTSIAIWRSAQPADDAVPWPDEYDEDEDG